jgi:hypothetical protein
MTELHHFTLGRARITTKTCGESGRMMISEEAEVQGGSWVLDRCADDCCSNISTESQKQGASVGGTVYEFLSHPSFLLHQSKSNYNSICPQMMLNLK